MRFDNAFLTKAGNVGMQFVTRTGVLTVYRDHEGKIVCSEEATVKEFAALRDNFVRREGWYKPKKKAIIPFTGGQLDCLMH